jgi:hypothetical protein
MGGEIFWQFHHFKPVVVLKAANQTSKLVFDCLVTKDLQLKFQCLNIFLVKTFKNGSPWQCDVREECLQLLWLLLLIISLFQ